MFLIVKIKDGQFFLHVLAIRTASDNNDHCMYICLLIKFLFTIKNKYAGTRKMDILILMTLIWEIGLVMRAKIRCK